MSYRIALAAGDGIGSELMPVCRVTCVHTAYSSKLVYGMFRDSWALLSAHMMLQWLGMRHHPDGPAACAAGRVD